MGMILTEPTEVDHTCSILGENKTSRVVLEPHSSKSRTPWWDRDDPYYEPWLFDNPINWQYKWRAEDSDYVVNIHGDVAKSKQKVPDFHLDDEVLGHIVGSAPMRRIISALHGWHQLNAKQLCAFTGILPQNLSRYTKPLFGAGIIERGEYFLTQQNVRRNFLWKLSYNKNCQRLLDSFSTEDVYKVWFNIKASGPRPHERHNITTAEIILRWFEISDMFAMQGVSPERLNTPDRMLVDEESSHTGDAVIVRADGLRIVLEISQAVNISHLSSKMSRWHQLLAKRPYSQSGIHVIFVDCSPYLGNEMGSAFRRIHSSKLIPEVTGLDARTNTRAAARITFASYKDWFPDRWMISEDFVNLRSARRVGESAKAEDWGMIDLMGPDQITFSPEEGLFDWYAPSTTLRELYCTPPWIDDLREVTP